MNTRSTSTLAFLAAAVTLALAGLTADAAMIGYYSFDDGTGIDGSGAGNNGTMGSSITFGSDVPFGTGLSGENHGTGAANVMTVPTSPTLESIDDQLTLSFWMKANTTDNDSWERIFQHGTEGSNTRTWLIDQFGSSGKTNMRVDTQPNDDVTGDHNQNIATGGPVTFDDQWHYVFYTVDTGNFGKIVNDVSVTTGTYKDGDGLYNTRPLYIFGRNGGGEYVGMLDDIGIWNTALSLAEGQAIYNLAMEPGLAYGAGNAQALFDLFAAGGGATDIGGDNWVNTSGLTGSPGDVVHVHGARYALVLDSAGNGVVMIPEPATLLVWSLLAGLGIGLGWRRRK